MSAAARRRLVVGNWKMNGSRAANATLLRGVLEATPFAADVAVCAPFPYLADVRDALSGSAVRWGAQDCSAHDAGAYTGEVAASMLAELGCAFVIVGHSERRAMHGESDALVGAKAARALAAGLVPIACVGETVEERDAGRARAVIERQLAAVVETLGATLSRIVVAYEPVWAIGTGRTASPEQAREAHGWLRDRLDAAGAAAVPVLYGGSVKPDNAAALFAQPGIDGGLVGGASLKAADFVAIAGAASTTQSP